MLLEKQTGRRRSFVRDPSGASAIEFALVSPVLLFMLISIFELGSLSLMSSSVDNAVNAVSRMIRTGRSDGPTSAADFENKVCAQMGANIMDCRSRIAISVDKFTRFSDANLVAASPPNGSFNKGGAGDIIVVKVNYQWQMLNPLLLQGYTHSGPFAITISSRAAFKNEPFS